MSVAGAVPSGDAPSGAGAARERRVLVIDDNAVDRMLYRRIMARSGYFRHVHAFGYATEALDWLDGNGELRVDAILLDVNMPRMNGFEFLAAADERLGERFDACVVIMLTTSLDPDDVERARTFGAVRGYVNKPLTLETLERVVALVDARAEERERTSGFLTAAPLPDETGRLT